MAARNVVDMDVSHPPMPLEFFCFPCFASAEQTHVNHDTDETTTASQQIGLEINQLDSEGHHL